MNRKLLVSLLRKSIEELEMITEGFMEMDEYPKVILLLAKRKTEDIQSIIEQLSEIKQTEVFVSPVVVHENLPTPEVVKTETPAEPIIVEKPNPVIEPHPEPEIIIEETTEIVEEIETIEEIEKIVENDLVEEIETIEENELVEEVELNEEIELIEELEEDAPDMQTIELEQLEEEFEKMKPVEFSIIEAEKEEIILEPVSVQEIKTEIVVERKETRIEELVIRSTSEETRVMTLAEKIAPSKISRSDKLSQADNTLSASIANKKISDIKQAISIGDRFRFQRELFGGNGEDMNKTLNYINQLASFDEVMSFLKNKYKWNADDNDVIDFVQIVKRKFN